MGRPKSIAVQPTSTEAPAPAAAPSAPSKRATLTSPEFTEDQRSAESLLPQAMSIFGDDPPEEKVVQEKEPKKRDEAKPDPKPKADEAKPDEEKDETPTLPDEEEIKAPGDEEEDGDKDKSALEKERFEKRELKREHKAEVKALKAEMEELKARANEVSSNSPAPDGEGYFKGVKTVKEIQDRRAQLESFDEFYDLHDEGYTEPDGTERDRLYVKAERLAIKKMLKHSNELEKSFEKAQADHSSRKEKATKTAEKFYGFVSDPESKYNATVLELAKEHPEAAKAPDAALVLGRMTIGKLWESGKYKLVLASEAKPKTTSADTEKPAPAARKLPPESVAREPVGDDVYSRMRNGDQSAIDRAAMSVFG